MAPPPVSASPAVPSVSGKWRGRFGWGLVAIVVVFAAVRLAGVFGDLWMDEIWSVWMVEPLTSPVEILTKVQHDNNHPLNSLWLYLLKPSPAPWAARLFSWAMGAVAVGLAGLVARRQFAQLHGEASAAQADVAGWLTAGIFGGSYFMIHYASEARGYAAVVAFALLAIHALLHAAVPAWRRWAAVYGVACVLGLLSHLVMLQVMLAGLAWTALAMVRDGRSWGERFGRAAAWHAGPWIFAVAYYLGFVRHLKIGGGPKYALASVLGDVAAFTTGWPAAVGAQVALPVMLAVVLAALVLVARRNPALATFYTLAVLVTPAIDLAGSHFELLFPRYFIVSAALALLLAGYLLARIWRCGRAGLLAALALLSLFFVGNGVHTVRLARDGRGQYQAAVRYLAAHTPTAGISVAGDHDFRNLVLLEYYQSAAGPGRSVDYYTADRMPESGVQWLLVQWLDDKTSPEEVLTDVRGNRYRLDAVFRHAALSGWDWYVYRSEQL